MNAYEVFGLTTWVDEHIKKQKLLRRFEQLHVILNENVQPNVQKKPFIDQKRDLLQAIRAVPLALLNAEQRALLDEIKIGPLVGDAGAIAVEHALGDTLDIATAATKIGEMRGQLSGGLNKSEQLHEALNGMSITTAPPATDPNGVVVRIKFDGGASIRDLSDLKTWAESWFRIARGVTIAVNESPESFKIIGVDNGSIMLILLTTGTSAKVLNGIMLGALKVAHSYQDLMKKAAETRTIEIHNEAAELSLQRIREEYERAATSVKESEVDRVTAAVLRENNVDTERRGDIVNELKDAVDRTVDFVRQGGSIEVLVPPSIDGVSDTETTSLQLQKLQEQNVRIRELTEKLRLIGCEESQERRDQ